MNIYFVEEMRVIAAVLPFLLCFALVQASHVFMESVSNLFRRNEVKKIRCASKQSLHTVIVAVKQKNIDELK